MEWGVVYLVAALVLFGAGLTCGLKINEARALRLEERLAAQVVANEALRRQGNAAVDAMGRMLQNVRDQVEIPASKSGVIRLFGGTSDPSADTPATGAPRP